MPHRCSRRFLGILLSAVCLLSAAAGRGDSGPWSVHYVLPPQISAADTPAEVLRGVAYEVLQTLDPGVILLPRTGVFDEQAAYAACKENADCMRSSLAKLGVQAVWRLEVEGQVSGSVFVTMTRFDGRLPRSSRRTCSSDWPQIALGVERSVLDLLLADKVAGRTLSPAVSEAVVDEDEPAFPPANETTPEAQIDRDLGERLRRMPAARPPRREISAASYPQGDDAACADCAPRHMIYLPAFAIDATEAPLMSYLACMLAGNCTPPVNASVDPYCAWGSGGSLWLPVNCVTWTQARDYCSFFGGRLPTEAEWEAAARGVAGRRYPWGDADPACAAACSDGALHAIDEPSLLPPTPEGVADMAGGLWEWVADWSQSDAYRFRGPAAPQGPETGSQKVIRGGSWVSSSPDDFAAFHRGKRNPDRPSNAVGFRCVYDL